MTIYEEIGAVLRAAIRGEVECSAPKELTDWTKASEPYFNIGGWELWCSVEADWIEYIDEAIAPDGRHFSLDNAPMSLFLSDSEANKLCLKLGRQPREGIE